MHWLHFIGRSYYTTSQFIEEAAKFEVSRRVATRLLSGFTWGDAIWLADGEMMKKNRKSPVHPTMVFGYFELERLSGFTPQTLEILGDGFELDRIKSRTEGQVVKRGCGEYVIDQTFVTTGSVHDIATYVREGGISDGLLLQGRLHVLQPAIFLSDVHFRWGYRKFDGKKFSRLAMAAVDAGTDPPIVLSGEFRVDDGDNPNGHKVKSPQLQSLKSYRLKDLWGNESAPEMI